MFDKIDEMVGKVKACLTDRFVQVGEDGKKDVVIAFTPKEIAIAVLVLIVLIQHHKIKKIRKKQAAEEL